MLNAATERDENNILTHKVSLQWRRTITGRRLGGKPSSGGWRQRLDGDNSRALPQQHTQSCWNIMRWSEL